MVHFLGIYQGHLPINDCAWKWSLYGIISNNPHLILRSCACSSHCEAGKVSRLILWQWCQEREREKNIPGLPGIWTQDLLNINQFPYNSIFSEDLIFLSVSRHQKPKTTGCHVCNCEFSSTSHQDSFWGFVQWSGWTMEIWLHKLASHAHSHVNSWSRSWKIRKVKSDKIASWPNFTYIIVAITTTMLVKETSLPT